jgi:hypothetical protein
VKPKDSRNSGGVLFHAPPPLAARGFTRRLEKQAAGEILPSSSPAVTATSTCNKKRKKGGQKQLILDLSFCFLDAFLPSPSSDLLHCGSAVMGLSSSPLFRVADRAALQCAEGDGGSVAALLADSGRR